jgi:hypothetical protein
MSDTKTEAMWPTFDERAEAMIEVAEQWRVGRGRPQARPEDQWAFVDAILAALAPFVAAREAAAGDVERARLADRMAALAEQADDPERAEFLREAAAWTRTTKTHRTEVSR